MSIKEKLNLKMNESKEKFKDMTFKEKMGYFWDYYKLPFIVTLVVIISLIALIHSIVSNSYNRVMYISIYNSPLANAEDIATSFGNHLGIDNDKDRVEVTIGSLGTNLNDEYYSSALENLAMKITAKENDVVIATDEASKIFLSLNCATDLTEVLPKDVLNALEGRLFYANKVAYDDDGNPITHSYPCGIYIEDTQFAKDSKLYLERQNILFVVSNTPRKDKVITFIKYIFNLQ